MEAQQCVQLTGTNRSSGLIPLVSPCPSAAHTVRSGGGASTLAGPPLPNLIARSSPAWWPRRSRQTRSHPELGRQTLQRPWYCASRPGRVGRRQARQDHAMIHHSLSHDHDKAVRRPTAAGQDAGWSSPVARQAHNLKAAGSNPAPATIITSTPPKPPHATASGAFVVPGAWRSTKAAAGMTLIARSTFCAGARSMPSTSAVMSGGHGTQRRPRLVGSSPERALRLEAGRMATIPSLAIAVAGPVPATACPCRSRRRDRSWRSASTPSRGARFRPATLRAGRGRARPFDRCGDHRPGPRTDGVSAAARRRGSRLRRG